MSKSQTGSNAVHYLSIVINSNSRLKADIEYKGNTDVWDGHIFVFGDDEHTAADVRKVPVQIKGKSVKLLDVKTLKHPIKKSELQNYAKDLPHLL